MIAYIFLQRRRRKPAYLKNNNLSQSTRKSLFYLFIIFTAHSLLMMTFEKMSFGDALWLTLTTATTVGYGDLSASTLEGRISTIVLLYMGGIFVLANFAGEYFEYRLDRRTRMIKGLWRWSMAEHIVIINTPTRGGTEFFIRLVTQLRQNEEYQDMPIQILTRQFPEGLPDELRKLGVVHCHGYPDKPENLEAVNIKEASAVIILTKDEYEITSDALTFDILHRLKEFGVSNINVIAECVDDGNRNRFTGAGASAVVRPVRAYPEILVRALVAPGSEKILENLFQHEGDHTRRYDVDVNNTLWEKVVSSLLVKGYGTAIAYVDKHNELICNPAPGKEISLSSIIILVRAGHVPSSAEVSQTLALQQL